MTSMRTTGSSPLQVQSSSDLQEGEVNPQHNTVSNLFHTRILKYKKVSQTPRLTLVCKDFDENSPIVFTPIEANGYIKRITFQVDNKMPMLSVDFNEGGSAFVFTNEEKMAHVKGVKLSAIVKLWKFMNTNNNLEGEAADFINKYLKV